MKLKRTNCGLTNQTRFRSIHYSPTTSNQQQQVGESHLVGGVNFKVIKEEWIPYNDIMTVTRFLDSNSLLTVIVEGGFVGTPANILGNSIQLGQYGPAPDDYRGYITFGGFQKKITYENGLISYTSPEPFTLHVSIPDSLGNPPGNTIHNHDELKFTYVKNKKGYANYDNSNSSINPWTRRSQYQVAVNEKNHLQILK